MATLFKCRHPFKYLKVQKDSTEDPAPDYPNDFNHVTHHLYCRNCGKLLDIKYAKMLGTVEEFLKRN